MIANLLSQSGTLVQRSQTGPEDDRGLPTWITAEVSVACHIQPRKSEEFIPGGATMWLGWFPTGTDLDSSDALIVDGFQYEIVGPARSWLSPASALAFIEADLRLIDRALIEESS